MIDLKYIIYFLLICFLSFSSTEVKVLYPNRGLTGSDDYGYQLLKLVLPKVNSNYKVTLASDITNQDRAIYKTKSGDY